MPYIAIKDFDIVMKDFEFDRLSPGRQHLALQQEAQRVYEERTKRRDWDQAVRKLATPANHYPKDEIVRPVAQAISEARIAQETEEMRREAMTRDWSQAKWNLRGSYCTLPAEPWAEYDYNALTPEQQRLAIEDYANRIYRVREEYASVADWYKAVEKLKETGSFPSHVKIEPVAQAIYNERQTEENRQRAEKEDWRKAEEGLKSGESTAWMPVARVPQLPRPQYTYHRPA